MIVHFQSSLVSAPVEVSLENGVGVKSQDRTVVWIFNKCKLSKHEVYIRSEWWLCRGTEPSMPSWGITDLKWSASLLNHWRLIFANSDLCWLFLVYEITTQCDLAASQAVEESSRSFWLQIELLHLTLKSNQSLIRTALPKQSWYDVLTYAWNLFQNLIIFAIAMQIQYINVNKQLKCMQY